MDFSFASDILEALARIGDEVEQQVLSVLSRKIENLEQNPMKWMEPLMVILAGLLQMDAAVPLILGKLQDDDSLLAGYCIEALSRIGTDAYVAHQKRPAPAQEKGATTWKEKCGAGHTQARGV